MIPIFDTDLIKEKIVAHLGDAKKSIEIAMAWFTDTDLERVVFRTPQYFRSFFVKTPVKKVLFEKNICFSVLVYVKERT